MEDSGLSSGLDGGAEAPTISFSDVGGDVGLIKTKLEGMGIAGFEFSAGLTSVGDCEDSSLAVVQGVEPLSVVSSGVMSTVHQGVKEADFGGGK
ncbi:hypothetical protein ACOSQ3_002677 [Xanthoceras sorbifolium]